MTKPEYQVDATPLSTPVLRIQFVELRVGRVPQIAMPLALDFYRHSQNTDRAPDDHFLIAAYVDLSSQRDIAARLA